MSWNRRKFLQVAGAGGLAAVGLTPNLKSAAPDLSRRAAPGTPTDSVLPNEWRSMRKWDVHNHVFTQPPAGGTAWPEVENLVEAADIVGIDRLFCSRPILGGVLADSATVRSSNDVILAAMRRFPERIFGYCFVQPGNGVESLDEIERCLDLGMIGVKLYNQFKFTDPVIFPIAERCIQRGIPFLGHSAFLTDPQTYAAQPKTSNALDFCALSRRYPELLLIMGHVNGGGDWEWAIKALRTCENVFLDTSGSVIEDDAIDRCVQELGHHRILFATDGIIEAGVGKVLSAALTSEQREAVLWRNFDGILKRRRA